MKKKSMENVQKGAVEMKVIVVCDVEAIRTYERQRRKVNVDY